jgi:plastocyanin
MTRLAVAIAVALVALSCPAAAQMGHDMHGGTSGAEGGQGISILFDVYSPTRIDVLAGDTVRWTNRSVRAHSVSADDGSWDSARLLPRGSFSRRFDAPGTATYFCTLHTFMRGEVDVHTVLLDAPAEPGAPGRAYTLRGRAALAPGATVSIEADDGSGFHPVATATVDDEGTFDVDVVPRTTTMYRVVAGDETSPPVQLLVLDRKLTASARGGGRHIVVSAQVAPSSPGADVVLQLRLRDRFGWFPVAHARLDRSSRARFRIALRHRVPARVVLTLSDGATPLAISRTMHVGGR